MARLNLCVALQRSHEPLAALHEAHVALDVLMALPAERLEATERATLEGIARYNLMWCAPPPGSAFWPHPSDTLHPPTSPVAVTWA